MRLKTRNCILWIFVLFLGAETAHARVWPFDQRQVLLASVQGSDFPSSLLTAQVMDVFVEKGRVRWITRQSSEGTIRPVQVPSDFSWNRSSAVRSLGLRYKADGILVLVWKDSRIDLRWYAVADGNPLYFETLYLPASNGTPEQDAQRRDRLRTWLLDIWAKVPGQGYVVKRDLENIFVEGVQAEGLEVGDRLALLRLERAKRHPVLKTLIGFESSETGFAKIESIEDPFAKARVEYESKLDPIQEGDRYLLSTVAVTESPEKQGVPEQSEDANPEPKQESSPLAIFPSLGDANIFNITPEVGWGALSYEERTAAEVYNLKSQSFAAGFTAELLITSSWFAAFEWNMGTGSFGDLPTDYGEESLSSGWSQNRFYTGYRMSLGDYAGVGAGTVDFFGGYSRFHMKLAESSADVAPSAKTYSGIGFGASIDMPVADRYSMHASFERVLGTFMGEASLTSGASSSNTLWSFGIGAGYALDERSKLSVNYGVTQGNSNFEGSGTRTTAALSSKSRSTQFSVGYLFKM